MYYVSICITVCLLSFENSNAARCLLARMCPIFGPDNADSVSLIPHKNKIQKRKTDRTRLVLHHKLRYVRWRPSFLCHIRKKRSTSSHAFPLWLSWGATTEPGTGLWQSPTLQPDVDVIYAHTWTYNFHIAINIKYAMCFIIGLTYCAKKNTKRSQDPAHDHDPFTIYLPFPRANWKNAG